MGVYIRESELGLAMEVIAIASDRGPVEYRVRGWASYYAQKGWGALALHLSATGLAWRPGGCGAQEARSADLTAETRPLLADCLAETVWRQGVILLMGCDREAASALQGQDARRAALNAFIEGEAGPIRVLIEREPDLDVGCVFVSCPPPAPVQALLARWGIPDGIHERMQRDTLRDRVMGLFGPSGDVVDVEHLSFPVACFTDDRVAAYRTPRALTSRSKAALKDAYWRRGGLFLETDTLLVEPTGTAHEIMGLLTGEESCLGSLAYWLNPFSLLLPRVTVRLIRDGDPRPVSLEEVRSRALVALDAGRERADGRLRARVTGAGSIAVIIGLLSTAR